MRWRTVRGSLGVTELGLGAAQLGNLYRETTDLQARGAIDAAWSSGVRYFDTAPHYGLGLSERRVGAALMTRPRDEYVISTKVGRLLVPSPSTADRLDDEGFAVPADTRRRWDLTAGGIRRSIEESLERLGLDRIDIAYLHDPDDFADEAVSTALPALVALRDEGLLGAVGAGMNQSAMLARFVRESDIDVVMLAGRYTLLEQGALDDLLPVALERGVSVVAAGVYNSGLLSKESPPDSATYDYGPAPRELIEKARRLAEVCGRFGTTLPVAAIAFALRHPAVVSVVLGARDPEQAITNAERAATHVPDELWVELEALGLIRSAGGTP